MKYIKPMNCEEFAQYLLTLKTGNTIEFGTDPGVEWPDEVPDVNNVEAWYFARVMEIPEYGSRFILLDYAGGEEAFAIPLNGDHDYCDEDDKWIVPGYVKQYFENHREIGGADCHVFVEMEE